MEQKMEFIAIGAIILVIIAVQNYIFKKFSFKNLEYRCYFDTEQAIEGDKILLIEEISNKGWLPLPWLKSEITTSKWLDFAGTQSVVTDESRFVPSFFMVKSYQKITRKWNVTCLKRGEFPIERVVLVSSDLLGNVSLSSKTQVDTSVVVFPAPFTESELTVSPKYFYGEIIVKRHLLEDPFIKSGVREYSTRDGMNKIHWAATAKEQNLMVFNNDYTSSQSVTVLLNMQSMEVERFQVINTVTVENAIRVCAGIFDSTLVSGVPMRFMANGSVHIDAENRPIETPQYWGREFVTELFYILARLKLEATRDFVHYLNEIYQNVTTSDLILVTPYINKDIMEFAISKQDSGVRVKLVCLGHVPPELYVTGIELVSLFEYFKKEEAQHE